MVPTVFTISSARILRWLLVLACVMPIVGCGSVNSMLGGNSEKDALQEMTWSYAEDGIQLEVHADPDLNEAGGQPHMLVLSLVQMEDPSAFKALTASTAAIKKLLLTGSPPDGTLALQKLYIAPGEQRQLQLVRVEKAKYIGLVAGYDHLDPARSARLYRIGVQVDASGIVVRKHTAAPEPLKISLRLGPAGIQESPSGKAVPVSPVKPQAGLVEPPATPSEAPSIFGASSQSSTAPTTGTLTIDPSSGIP